MNSKPIVVTLSALSCLMATPAVAADISRKKLSQWGDPLTPPQTKTDCVDWASGDWPWGGSWKTCKGWRTQVRSMQVEAFLVVSGPDNLGGEVMNAVKRCTVVAAAAAAGAGYASGGTAAVAAAKIAFSACLGTIGSDIAEKYSINVETSSHWSDWG